MSSPMSPIKTRHFDRDSVPNINENEMTEKGEHRSDASAAALLEMDTTETPQQLDYMDLEKQNGDRSRPRDKFRNTKARLTMWMVLNTVATVAIVREPMSSTPRF